MLSFRAAKAAEESERRPSVGSRKFVTGSSSVAPSAVQAHVTEEQQASEKILSSSPERTVNSGLGDEILDDWESDDEINIPGSVPELRGASALQMRGIDSSRTSTPRKPPNASSNHVGSNRASHESESFQHSPKLSSSGVSEPTWSFVNNTTETGKFLVSFACINFPQHNDKLTFDPAKDVARGPHLQSKCCLALLRTNNKQGFRFLG